MKQIKLIEPEVTIRYPADCERIVQAFKDKGYVCSMEQANVMWERLSESWDAGWLNLSVADDYPDGIVGMLRPYFTWVTL